MFLAEKQYIGVFPVEADEGSFTMLKSLHISVPKQHRNTFWLDGLSNATNDFCKIQTLNFLKGPAP